MAWPREEVMETMVEGTDFVLTPVAKSMTDQNGHYLLKLDPSVDLATVRSGRGGMDLTVVAHDAQRFSTNDLSVSTTGDGDPAWNASLDSSTGTVSQAAQIDAVLSDSNQGDGSGAGIAGCTYQRSLGTKLVHLNHIWLGKAGSSARFTYEHSSSSSLGAGYSVSGTYGSWSQSGTISRATTSGGSYGWNNDYKGFYTYYRYGRYSCSIPNPAGNHYYAARPYAWYGTFKHTDPTTMPSVPRSHCGYQQPGWDRWWTTTRATTWASGVTIEGTLGINLSAQTGFTSQARNYIKVDQGGVICGLLGSIGTRPGSPARQNHHAMITALHQSRGEA